MEGSPQPAPALAPAWTVERVRAALHAGLDYAWDNPTAEHEERAILVGPKVGLWLGLELLVLLLGALIAFAGLPEAEPALRAALAELGPGTYLITATQASLALFLTLIVPLRAVGLLEGPRWRGYLDQLVTTGITPWRYYAGKWATTQPFLLALLAATLPLTCLFALLGGMDPWRTLVGYGLLFAYGNLLLAVSLALGVVLHEILALLCAWSLFSALTFLDYLPVPSTLAVGTPHRYLIQPFVPHLAGSSAEQMARLFEVAHPLGLALPWLVWALLVWALVGVIAALGCAIGPLHAFAPGMNNFGAVVLPGDRSRSVLRRSHPVLQRRVELAFLFENRGPRLVRWTLAVRALQQLLVLGLLAVILPSAALDPNLVGSSLQGPEAEGLHLTACALVLLITLVTLCHGRGEARQVLAVGRYRIPLPVLDLGVFLSVCAGLFAVHLLAHAAAWEGLGVASRWRGRLSPEAVWSGAAATLAVCVTTAASAFLLSKALGGRFLGRGAVLLLTTLYLAAVIFAPLFAATASAGLGQADEVPPQALALVRPLWVVGEASPAVPIALAWERELPPWLGVHEEAPWLLSQAFWVWHPAWILLLLPRVIAQLLAGRDAGEAQERRRRGLSPRQRCPRCPAGEAIPLRWSWWGGMVGPRALGYQECLDCGATWAARTGRPAWGGAIAVLLARLGLAALVTLVATLLLVSGAWGLL